MNASAGSSRFPPFLPPRPFLPAARLPVAVCLKPFTSSSSNVIGGGFRVRPERKGGAATTGVGVYEVDAAGEAG